MYIVGISYSMANYLDAQHFDLVITRQIFMWFASTYRSQLMHIGDHLSQAHFGHIVLFNGIPVISNTPTHWRDVQNHFIGAY